MSHYPITIFTARYQGTYEGAQWLALNEHTSEVSWEAQGDDVSCMVFFDTYEQTRPIGRGASPQQAYADLVQKLDERDDGGWPWARSNNQW